MNLIEIYKPMIYSIIKKYDIPGYTSEDLFQEGSIAVLQAEKSYNESKGMKMETWVYNCINWRMSRLVEANKKYNCEVSYNTTINDGDGNQTEVIDTIADLNDSYEEIEDLIMLDTYKTEIENNLPEDKADLCILKWFNGFSNKDIEASLNVHNVNSKIRESRMQLVRKSPLFREEYCKIHGIRENIPEQAII